MRLTVCGELPAFSVIVTAANRLPAAAGSNVTLMVQLAPAATLAPQLLVCEKSPAFVPAMAIEVIDRAEPPLLASLTICALLMVPTV